MVEEISKIYFKTIIQGRLEFGTAKSFGKIHKMYIQRSETYYKSDVIFKVEEIFDEQKLTLEIPRYVGQHSEKTYKGTIALLDYCAQFAVAGSIRAWVSDAGMVKHYDIMEPKNDKGAVQAFIKGRSLVRVEGQEEAAIAAFDKAIKKYDRHGQAYERRAKVNFLLEKYNEAARDYTKCINIDPTIPNAFYGRAKCYALENKYEAAIEDLEMACKKSVALQGVYWKARRMKSELHIEQREWEKAEFDLKLFCNRKFAADSELMTWKRWAWFNYGVVLFELKKYKEADEAFTTAFEHKQYTDLHKEDTPEAIIYRFRGLVKKLGNISGYTIDLKKAIELGDEVAQEILKG